MKKIKIVLVAGLLMAISFSCTDNKDRYIDLSTGQPIELVKDESTGLMVHESTKKPVYIYVDTKNNDTIYGKTGQVINGLVVKAENNKYVFEGDEKLKIDDDGSVKYKDDDYKMKMEKDGDIKIKDGDKKVKIDGETGERKVKNDD